MSSGRPMTWSARTATWSKGEETLYWQLKHLGQGSPLPEREFIFAPARKWRFDFAWPDELVAVEVEGLTRDGGRHQRNEGYEADLEKYNAAALEGWLVLRFTSRMVDAGTALQRVLQALHQRRARS